MLTPTDRTPVSVSHQQRRPHGIRQLLVSGRYWIYLLVLGAISLVDYAYMVAAYLNWLNPWVFLILHEIHDAIGLVPITLAARRFRGRAGYMASAWFGLVHTPHYYLVWPDVGRLARLMVICAIGGFISYLVDLYYKESRERENVYRDMLATRERLIHLDEIFQLEKMHALGRVAAGVAHDFNNILAAIVFQAEVALRLAKDQAIRPSLENIQQAALDGAETVKRIREFTRTQPSPEGLGLVDLRKIVESALEMSQPQWKDQAQARGATIRIESSLKDSPPIRGNAAQLRQVLVNLIINAVEAMPQGGNIRIESARKNNSVALMISDNGIGMDEDTARRAFEPFFTTKGPLNTGLGLSAAYGIVARHGGHIALQSHKGRGTTFTITLPVADEGPLPEAPTMADTSPIKKLNILVVDDEPLVAQGLAELLRLQGHQVGMYTSPLQAVAAFQRGKYDAVFSDLGMPEMNGWQLCANIKKLSPQIPIVILTGWGTEAKEEAQKQASQADFILGKPVVAEKLNQVIREISSRPIGVDPPAP